MSPKTKPDRPGEEPGRPGYSIMDGVCDQCRGKVDGYHGVSAEPQEQLAWRQDLNALVAVVREMSTDSGSLQELLGNVARAKVLALRVSPHAFHARAETSVADVVKERMDALARQALPPEEYRRRVLAEVDQAIGDASPTKYPFAVAPVAHKVPFNPGWKRYLLKRDADGNVDVEVVPLRTIDEGEADGRNPVYKNSDPVLDCKGAMLTREGSLYVFEQAMCRPCEPGNLFKVEDAPPRVWGLAVPRGT